MEEQGMSLRKRARSLRRADSASELPLLREAMAAPEGASKPTQEGEDEGVSPSFRYMPWPRFAFHCCCPTCCLSHSMHGMRSDPHSFDTVKRSFVPKCKSRGA